MAVLVFAKEKALEYQGVKSAQPIEWVKITAVASTTGEGAAYTFRDIKNCSGILGAGPFAVAINNTTKAVTFTPLITTTGVYIVGLVQS